MTVSFIVAPLSPSIEPFGLKVEVRSSMPAGT
jgi:hypothetical protein